MKTKASPSTKRSPRTLTIDIGATGIKATVLDAKGVPLWDPLRVETPKPATPRSVLRCIDALVTSLPPFDRVSVGFPGVVVAGVVRTAVNLAHKSWVGFDLAHAIEKRFGVPARVLNDAGVQGFGVIEGKGVEMVLTLGTGMGCALFVDGRYVPNLELAHHPFRGKKTYEDYIGQAALNRVGNVAWNRRVHEVVGQILPIFNPGRLYLGGGNSRLVRGKLPREVTKTGNIAGLLGGIALWREGSAVR